MEILSHNYDHLVAIDVDTLFRENIDFLMSELSPDPTHLTAYSGVSTRWSECRRYYKKARMMGLPVNLPVIVAANMLGLSSWWLQKHVQTINGILDKYACSDEIAIVSVVGGDPPLKLKTVRAPDGTHYISDTSWMIEFPEEYSKAALIHFSINKCILHQEWLDAYKKAWEEEFLWTRDYELVKRGMEKWRRWKYLVPGENQAVFTV